MTYNSQQTSEKLFLNTIRFEMPNTPVICYFSLEDIKGFHLKQLNIKNMPVGIETIFPGLKKNQLIYTSFCESHEGMFSLEVNLNDHKNYYFAKRYLNGKINHYFKSRGFIVDTNHITKDNEIWIYDKNGSKRIGCHQYDRFTLKIDYDNFNKQTQLVLSYDRPTWVYNKSVSQLLENQPDPFSDNVKPSFTLDLLNRVFYIELREDGKESYRIGSYSALSVKRKGFNNANAFPIIWPPLAEYLGVDDNEKDEDDIYTRRKVENRYAKYYNKIKFFYNSFLDNDDFRSVVNISKDGFSWASKLQIGRTSSSSQELVFGGGACNHVPQQGVNNGPLQEPKAAIIQLMYIFHEDDVEEARKLLLYFGKDGYKNFFKGVSKYIGKEVTAAPKGFHLKFTNKSNPLPEIRQFLQNLRKTEGVTYLAVYMTPYSKHTSDKTAREYYYRVKKLLMDHGINSQCIETAKMIRVLKQDEGTDKRGYPLKNFAYTLQNMSIAMNAKLGGIPWRIGTDTYDELVVGVGAFRVNGTTYIGSAFSFENTGIFNSFEYFLNDETEELAGSIEEAIIRFTQAKGIPSRLIIHYYKQMREDEYDAIESRLRDLNLEIPIYIISINKTESEDKVVFDGANADDLMPYSGRYVNLGAKTYLLCNNTRYEGVNFNPYDGFPFPVKLRIDCPYLDGDIPAKDIKDLIEQVYQFSRIYWKSVKQQNLPVTIKYPEMVAEIAPHFDGEAIPEDIGSTLWFL